MDVLEVRSLADRAVTLVLAEERGPAASRRVAAAQAALDAAIDAGRLRGALDCWGAFSSVTVSYDARVTSQAALVSDLRRHLRDVEPARGGTGRLWSLPCCYDGEAAADLPALSDRLGLPAGRIVDLHAGQPLEVLALGFLPGLPFLGDLPPELRVPRRDSPRTRVPAGSVAIANGLSVIYPWVSPGGWHILGRCPVPLFAPAGDPPALLRVGDRVIFVPTPTARLAETESALASGALRPGDFLADG